MTETATSRPSVDQGIWTFDSAHTRFGFTARHLMVTRVRGLFESFEGTIEIGEVLNQSRVDIVLDAASISTGNLERDAHLMSADFLDVGTYPELRFASKAINSDGEAWKVIGDLTIRDQTHPITLDVTYEGSAIDPSGNQHVAFAAAATMKRAEWDLTWNVPLDGGGWLVSPEVILDIEGELIRP